MLEKEKAQAIDEYKEAQKLAEDANEKLREALVAQKRAEENSEIEKFRAVEMEQAGIESAQKKEEEWLKELEAVRNQHALDVSALLSVTQELQNVKQELVMTSDAKNQALSHADDATKIAEIHADKVETLSAELARLKALLDTKLEMESSEQNEMVMELKSQLESLKLELQKAKNLEEKLVEKESFVEQLNVELEKAKNHEEKLVEKEGFIEQLNVELEAAKMAEYYACNLMEEWKKRVEELEDRTKEANRLERSASESLESVMKQLEESNDMLQDAESEIASLKEKVGLLEMTIVRQRGDLVESESRLDVVKEEVSLTGKKVESLTSELETVKEEKTRALNNEKLAAASVQNLLEEKNKLYNELEKSRDEEEKSKKAMESLASALHEVSSEAREAKEKLLYSQGEHERYEAQIEDLKLVLKTTNEKYEGMIDDAKHEIDVLTNLIEQSKVENQNSKVEWEQKEIDLTNRVHKYEEENASMEEEMTRLANLLKVTEKEACATKEDEARVKSTLREAESEVIYLKEVLGEAKAESMRLKESLLDNENELQGVIQENDELRAREAASLKKIEELTKLIEENMAKKQTEENGELTDSEKDYDMLPKVVEFSEQNGGGNGKEEKPVMELPLPPLPLPLPPQHFKFPIKEKHEESVVLVDETAVQKSREVENLNGDTKKEKENKEKEDDDSSVVEFKMWESCNIGEKDFSPETEKERESFEEEVDSKAEENNDHINGLSSTENIENGETSPLEQQSQKKKKPFLRKFGSLLKKKGPSNNHK